MSSTFSPLIFTPPCFAERIASEVEGTSPASFNKVAKPISPSKVNSGISSGIAPFWNRLINSCSAASAAASSWKRAMISLANKIFTSRGFLPFATSAFNSAISVRGRKESKLYQSHIKSSEIDMILPNISLGASVTPM